MNTRARLTGAVLAGGKSSRLGQDKCALTPGGQDVDLLTRAVRLLREILDRVVVVGREHPEAAAIFDEIPGTGPVGAIASALRRIRGPCLVLACDLPLMRAGTLLELVRAWEANKPEILVTAFRHADAGKKEYLAAVYEPGALPFLEARLERNLLKLSLAVPENRCAFVEIPPALEEDFLNCNRPEDLREAERKLARQRPDFPRQAALRKF